MARRTLDLGIPLTREQWEQLGRSAESRPDFGVLRWTPAESDLIHVAMREDEAPVGWGSVVPRADAPVSDHEVARFRWNDGRPYAEIDAPPAPMPPVITASERQALEQALERWVRRRWQLLLRESGLRYDRGAGTIDETSARPASGT